MDKETQQPDPAYVKGFNEGYAFAKYMPELSEQISRADAKSPRMIGMQDGRKEYLNEVVKDRFPDWLKQKDRYITDKTLAKSKGKDIERS